MSSSTTGRAIRPDEVAATKAKVLPAAVLDAFNVLIAKNFTAGRAIVTQDEAIAAICGAMGIDRHAVFANHYLDVEEVFREAGWRVEYDKPAYYENYEATFTFCAGK